MVLTAAGGFNTEEARKYFTAAECTFNDEGTRICPAGKPMKRRGPNRRDKKKGYTGRDSMGYPEYCGPCELSSRCMRRATTRARQVTKIDKGERHNQKSGVHWMRERFDTDRGRHLYSRRMGTMEPVCLKMAPSVPSGRSSRCLGIVVRRRLRGFHQIS